MTADITRLFPDRATRFHALVRQQGRLSIDAEENFASDISEWERDDTFAETIAPSGSPDDGFRITLPVAGPPANFSIAAGSFYLGGARIENPVSLTYRGQRDRNWLGFPLEAEGANEAIGANQRFLVWLDAFDHTVTATEDAELKDPGLGGPDGVTARRFGWRVRATPVNGPTCVLARTQWLAAMGWTTLVDNATGALSSGATLTVAFNPADVDHDLCAPALTPGFLGARNECYRVTTSRAGRYVWGRDDAAPVYRVRVESIAGQLRRIVFLTQPRDEHTRPRQGQTVELLQWDERLPNGQKTAEPLGTFFTVATGYTDGAITLTTPVDGVLTAWLAALPAATLSSEDPPTEQRYFYLRRWTGGGSAGQPDHAFASGDLVGTGLRLTFGGAPMPGDRWVIAARPNAPTQLLPWSLRTGKLPDGPRRHVVPLAFVDLAAGTVSDCRRRFRPLYRLGGCCTVTVGDEESSWGDVSTIAAAVARLPASGGEICIGPGTWRENITLDGRTNITFTGCGTRTHWLAGNPALPALSFDRSQNIRVRRLHMESVDAACVLASTTVSDVTLEECRLVAPSGGVVRIAGVQRLTIDRCLVECGPMVNPTAANASFAAVTMRGNELLLRHSVVRAIAGATPQALALGGVHVGGGSRDVTIADNRILDGAGNGITLGSARIVTVPLPAFTADPEAAIDGAVTGAGPGMVLGFTVSFDAAGCIRIDPVDPLPEDNGDGTIDVPVSDGAVWRVLVARNRIGDCGGNGIATYPLLPVDASGDPAWDAVSVEWLEVADNDIRGCCLREPALIPEIQRLFSCPGGISLGIAIDVTVRDNLIEDNGAEPARVACGLFVGYGEGVRVERNRIERNGGLEAVAGVAIGGIVVRAAMGGAPVAIPFSSRTTDRPALLVQGNVVHSPTGRALKALAQGPVLVTGNRLTGANRSRLFANLWQAIVLFLRGAASARDVLVDPASPDVMDLLLFDAFLDVLGGDAVNLVNLSYTEEMLWAYRRKTYFAGAAASSLAGGGRDSLALNLRGGETLFNDNQVSLRGGLGDTPAHLSSVFIMALDDIGFADNQCELEADVAFSFFDALLIGATLRATGNRLQEPVLCLGSLVTAGLLMNTTSLNQSTFFTLASCANAAKLVDINNTTIV